MIRVVFVWLTFVVIFTGAQAAVTSAETQDPTAVSANRYIAPKGTNFVVLPNPPPYGVLPNQCTNAAIPCLTLDWAAEQADPGDTIIAACGEYTAEETAVLNKNLTVRSQDRCAIFSAPGNRVINISNSSAVTLISIQVSGGDAGSGNGGGIRVRSGSSLIMEDVLVENNKAESGGGILVGGTLTMNNSVVRENDAADRGGGIRVGSSGSLTMNNSEVRLNFAGGQGGGIHSSGQSTVSDNSAVSFNDSLGSGAGIAADDGTLAISDSIINANFTAITPGPGGFINAGGGLHVSGATVTIARSFFTKNKADQGGGIDVSSGELIMESSTVSENVAVRAGGGLANRAETRVRNSTFSDNKAGEGDEPGEGGAFYNWGSFNNLFLTSVTAAYNEAGSGGGVYNASSANLSVANTIFAQHFFSEDCANVDGHIFIRSDYLTEDGTCPDALIFLARLGPLADNGGPTLTHMPGSLSEAVDRGDTAICASLGNVDQRMHSRVDVDGNGDPSDGNPCDLGAVERDLSPFSLSPSTIYMPLVSAANENN